MRAKHWKTTAAMAGLLFALSACGGGSTATTAGTTAPPATSVTSTTQATTTSPPATAATTTTAGTTAPSTTAGGGDDELIAAGEVLFMTTAGGVGCATCHGTDAMGIPDLAAPDIRGADFAMIADALATRAQMTTLTLSDADIKAVAAYLATLTADG